MPPKTSAWDNSELLVDLVVGLYQAAEVSQGLKPEIKDGIETFLQARGHNTTWNAIRQHVQKLRKSRDTSAITSTGNGNGSLVTPNKPAPKKNPGQSSGRKRAAPGSARGKLVKEDTLNDHDQDDEFDFQKKLFKQEITSDAEPDTPPKPVKRVRKTPTPTTQDGSADGDIEGEC